MTFTQIGGTIGRRDRLGISSGCYLHRPMMASYYTQANLLAFRGGYAPYTCKGWYMMLARSGCAYNGQDIILYVASSCLS